MLEATNQEFDNVWIKMFDKNKLKEEFNIFENIEPIYLINILKNFVQYYINLNYTSFQILLISLNTIFNNLLALEEQKVYNMLYEES